MVYPYSVACVQTEIHVAKDASDRHVIMKNLTRGLELAEMTCARGRNGVSETKIILFPEFYLPGSTSTWRRNVKKMQEVCIQIPGEETDIIGAKAKELGIYMCGGVFEFDPEWPDHYWNSSFIVDPSGKVALRYRKNSDSMNTTKPGDVFDEYIAKYGYDALFPVIKTPIGTVGSMICYDVCFPEIARMLALKGAEIILHPTGEPYGEGRGGWECAKRARAFENALYLMSANHGSMYGSSFPTFRSHGGSEVIDYKGEVVAQIGGPGEAVVSAMVDINMLRYRRNRAALTFVRPHLFAKAYAEYEGFPKNRMTNKPSETRMKIAEEYGKAGDETVKALLEKGIYRKTEWPQN
jgi:predicted amidohydrolase